MSAVELSRAIHEIEIACRLPKMAARTSSKPLLEGLTTGFAARWGAGAAREKKGLSKLIQTAGTFFPRHAARRLQALPTLLGIISSETLSPGLHNMVR